MDRGKRKMTADDIAVERRFELRKSQMSSGEGLRLQPSTEDVFVPPNEDYNTMIQQFLSARYVAATENAWTASAPMPTSFPQPVSTTNPMTIAASNHVPEGSGLMTEQFLRVLEQR